MAEKIVSRNKQGKLKMKLGICAELILWYSVVMTAFALMKVLCVVFFFSVMISKTMWLVEFAFEKMQRVFNRSRCEKPHSVQVCFQSSLCSLSATVLQTLVSILRSMLMKNRPLKGWIAFCIFGYQKKIPIPLERAEIC